MNIGYSGKLPYDTGVYREDLEESLGPGSYRLNPNHIHNNSCCLSTLGPRAVHLGYGVSTPTGASEIAPALKVVDIESDLSNRNLKNSKLRNQEVNFMNSKKYGLKNANICDHFLDPIASRITHPASCMYRGVAINRFYNLNKDPQENIYWDDRHDTKLEMKDNYKMKMPHPIENDTTLPPY